MSVHNKEIARILNQVADLLDIKDENQFRIRSYRNAARTISGMSEPVSRMAGNTKKIQSLPGIGESMAEKIREISDSGHLAQLEDLKKDIPGSLIDIMKLEQVGPQRTKILHEQLDIDTIDDLRKAVEEGKVQDLEGFGKKTSDHILREIKEYEKKGGSERIKLHEAREMVMPLIEYLEKEIDDVRVAGSYRRQKETVGDIDILCTGDDAEKVINHFTKYEEIKRVLSKGKKKSSVKLKTGLQVDLRIAGKKDYGAGLLYFTGSKAHSIALRKIGQEKNLKVNEYGIFKGKKRLASKTEEDMYKKLGLAYIEPEMREDTGEIDAARKNDLPDLIVLDDIRGDLQSHTKASDGHSSLEDMARAAQEKGYEYFAITDHSKKVAMANGLDEKRLAGQIEEIDALNQKTKKFRILKSVEVDILEDGSLDLPDDILKELDLVVCSIHYNRNLSKAKQTRRILRAMENPHFNILAHPTGRLIHERSAYDLDLEKIMKEAKDLGCFLEINANPDRLDLNDRYIRMARDMELKLAISTDAHSTDNLEYMRYGVSQARRGWLEKEDVINTFSWKELKKMLARK